MGSGSPPVDNAYGGSKHMIFDCEYGFVAYILLQHKAEFIGNLGNTLMDK